MIVLVGIALAVLAFLAVAVALAFALLLLILPFLPRDMKFQIFPEAPKKNTRRCF